MNRSPHIAPHDISQCRSYGQLQAGERLPEEDFHLSVLVRFQAHSPRRKPGGKNHNTHRVPEARQVNNSECVELLICRASGTLYGFLIFLPPAHAGG